VKTISGVIRASRIWTTCVVAAASAMACLPMRASAQTQQASACGALGPPTVSIGPYDYRVDREMVKFIEGNHFQPQVEALVGGVSGYIGSDLDFVLRHVPNDPKVLLTLIRYGEKLKWTPAPGLRFSYECYFDRAIRFRPDDPMVRMIYATYLNKFSRTQEALRQLAYAGDLAKDDGFAQYNVGLIYLEMKRYDLALAQAHKAISLGFAKTALSDGLKSAGKWKDPPSVPDASREPQPAASASPS
jgi:hypothetical protein